MKRKTVGVFGWFVAGILALTSGATANAEVVFREDFQGAFDTETVWDVVTHPGDGIAVYEMPAGSGNRALLGISTTYSARSGFFAKQTFQRGEGLRVTFRWWYEVPSGTTIDFTSINGPWRRTSPEQWGQYTYPIAEDLEAGFGAFIRRVSGTDDHHWSEGKADWQPAIDLDAGFRDAVMNATSRENSIMLRVELGDETGGRAWYSTNQGTVWNAVKGVAGTIVDSIGLAAGSTYQVDGGSVQVSANQTVYLGFGVRAGTRQWWDDILVEKTGQGEAGFTLPGLPQQDYAFRIPYTQGDLHTIDRFGTRGFVITPKGPVDPERRWLWIVPLWCALEAPAYGNYLCRYYIEPALAAGYHIVGIDVGTSCGSPAAAELFRQFHELVTADYDLNNRARMIAISNGGLITYGFAFRYPRLAERILAIYPATDFRSWPGIHHVAGPSGFPPAGLAYPVTLAELQQRIEEFNPIDNVEPLAARNIQLMHVHGDQDTLVPMNPNSTVFVERYRAAGGTIELDVLAGMAHGGMEFFTYPPARDFLLGETTFPPIDHNVGRDAWMYR